MTYSVEDRSLNTEGASHTEHITINITSLDSAGSEAFDEGAESRVGQVGHVTVVSQEDETYHIVWDHVAGNISVTDVADGTDTADNTDVGEVVLKVTGQ